MAVSIGDLALVQPGVGVGVVLAGAVVAAGAWRLRRRQAGGDPLWAAATDRVRRLPTYQRLLMAQTRARRTELAGAVLALLGLALLGSRLVGVDDDAEELRHRDVVLCMDVSGSMTALVEDVLDTYVDLAAQLSEERVGFVMFDANAVTGFALTDDHDEVAARLAAAKAELAEEDLVAGTSAPGSGSSLVGDGLASCVQHFDRLEEERARTLVLATDNLVSGDSIYTLRQATDLAVEHDVMVFGIAPEGTRGDAMVELRAQTARTHGDVLVVSPGRSTNVVVIADAIASQERTALLETAQERSFDLVAPGVLLVLLGLLLSSVGALPPLVRRASGRRQP